MSELEEESEEVARETQDAEDLGASCACARPKGTSKNQWKKQLKKQKLEEGRAEWRKKQKEKEKEKKRKRREEGCPVEVPPLKKHKMSAPNASPIQVAIDFGYQDLMTELDIKMLMKQCQRCYAANRRAGAPLQLSFTSFGGLCQKRLEKSTQNCYLNWDVHFRSEDYISEFGSENVIFLAAESPNILREFSPDKVYIIGGLVDHNHHKGHCYQNALSNGIAHAQLPIAEYLKLNCRNVLAVNHVYEIILAYSQCLDWRKAFQQVIPLRKQTFQADPSSLSPPPPPASLTLVASTSPPPPPPPPPIPPSHRPPPHRRPPPPHRRPPPPPPIPPSHRPPPHRQPPPPPPYPPPPSALKTQVTSTSPHSHCAQSTITETTLYTTMGTTQPTTTETTSHTTIGTTQSTINETTSYTTVGTTQPTTTETTSYTTMGSTQHIITKTTQPTTTETTSHTTMGTTQPTITETTADVH